MLGCKPEKRKSQYENGQPMKQTRGLFGKCDPGIITPVSLLANKFDDRIALHGQVCLEAVDHIYVFHESLNSCKISVKDSLKACFENVNICK